MTSTITAANISEGFSSEPQRNELLRGIYAAIDTEYRTNENNNAKPYTIFAVAIIDSLDIVKVKHESDFANCQYPEKELVKGQCLKSSNTSLQLAGIAKELDFKKKTGLSVVKIQI
jgi:hypothetical protein